MLPVLYSFRRCPYAIRTRYVLAHLNVSVELREVVLKSKPQALLALGGRTTVPQLIDVNGIRYPESLDIIFWALSRSNNQSQVDLLRPTNDVMKHKMMSWINYNDHIFKYWLDRYKYADRYPEFQEEYYRMKGERFLRRLDKRLQRKNYLCGQYAGVVDMAIFPFIRQFAVVNRAWFDASEYDGVKHWLARFVDSDFFNRVVMKKYSAWEAGQTIVVYPANKEG